MSKDNWLALESNPQVLNDYAQNLGFDISQFCFNDLFSTEQWAQDMIQKPVLGVVFIFPCNEKHGQYKKEEQEKIEKEGQHIDDNLFYMKQTAKNACGSVAMYHIMMNLPEQYKDLIAKGSILDNFRVHQGKTPEELAKEFEGDKSIREIHKESTNKGQTQTNANESIDKHFICFVNVNDNLYELDGGKKFPINHGKTTTENFLNDSCKVIQDFMKRDSGSLEFGIITLSKNVPQ